MISALVSRLISLGLGTLYPAYASYKAVRTKNVKEYVKWMMYWIVFALFTSVETFTDFFLAFWFPFYYEIKIVLLIWLLSPATKGSSLLYRKFVHPWLVRREPKIDEMISAAQTRSYDTCLQLGQRGVRYVTNFIMDQAVRTPALMQAAARPPQPRYPPATIREVGAGEDRVDRESGAGEMEVSEGEASSNPASRPSSASPDLVDHGLRRRKKQSAADLAFSSGGESDDPEFEPAAPSKPAVGRAKKGGASTVRKSTRKGKPTV